ncbi:MAG TPA: VWA domain-containing protein [Candidatus Methylomirabilis sp.]|nr:VWA domain-containing protein [Candidatus Methylomirabilis sp.]
MVRGRGLKSSPRVSRERPHAGLPRLAFAARLFVFARSVVFLVACTSIAFVLPPTLASPQNPAQTPPVRVTTRLVQIGVIVRDKNSPVENLTKDDFAILDRGKRQPIGLFSVESVKTAAAAPIRPLAPNTFSDLPQDAARPSSISIVLLDNLNTLYGTASESKYEKSPYWMEDLALRNAQLHLIEFIQQLQPQDRVAIYGLRHTLHILCDFTSDREQLLAILKNYDSSSITNRRIVEPGRVIMDLGGHDNPIEDIAAGAPMSAFENKGATVRAGAANEDRGAETMAALRQIAAHVANIPGRKNLVWLTANLPFSGATMARVLSPANIAVYPVDARGLLATSPMLLADIPGTADADDVSGASGHLDNMPAESSQPLGIVSMEELAGETGGQAFLNTNDITSAIRKAVEDSAVTYTLGFYINRDALDGKFHEVKVEVRRKDLSLRYPRGYFALPDTALTKSDAQQMLAAAVQSPLESSMIPVRATLERVNQPHPNTLSLACWIDARNIRFAQSGNVRQGTTTVYVLGQNAAGEFLHHWDKTYDLRFADNQFAELLNRGLQFHQDMQLRPDVTTLRVLVQDPATGTLGSLIIPLAQVH